MKPAQKKRVALLAGGAVLLWLGLARAAGRGRVIVGPVTVTQLPALKFDVPTQAAVQRLSLALVRMRQVCGYDPNTLASVQPSAADDAFCEQTLALGRQLHAQTNGLVPEPKTEASMLALARTLPGNTMAAVNAQLYALLGIDVRGENVPTVALTPAIDQKARQLISKWRPYSQSAVDTLFAQLDLSRELGGSA